MRNLPNLQNNFSFYETKLWCNVLTVSGLVVVFHLFFCVISRNTRFHYFAPFYCFYTFIAAINQLHFNALQQKTLITIPWTALFYDYATFNRGRKRFLNRSKRYDVALDQFHKSEENDLSRRRNIFELYKIYQICNLTFSF